MPSIAVRPSIRRVPFGIAGLALLFVVASSAARAAATLGPVSLRWLLPVVFVSMAALPWLLLSPEGRRQIGLKRPTRPSYYLLGIAGGALGAALCFALAVLLYGSSTDNWFVSIANSNYRIMPTDGWSLLRLHLTFTIAACLFSPIGEEIFFRGLLQRVLEQRFSVPRSSAIEAALFGLVHLCHHGILATAAGLVLLPGSGALWVSAMFALSLALAWLRKRGDSVLPAIVAHSAFNATMNILIFAYLWQ
jgi:membrane protease YdiL (CAAX protease family)